MLAKREIKVLQSLVEDPIASISKLSRMAEISPVTTKKILEKLYKNGYIGNVVANVNYPTINLELVYAVLSSNPQNWDLIEKIIDAFIYRYHRVRCLGAINGHWIIFNIPKGTYPNLREVLEAMRNRGLINNYETYEPTTKWIYAEPDFSKFNTELKMWKVNWDLLDKVYEEVSPIEPESFPPAVLDRLDKHDFMILDMITYDARVSGKELSEYTGLKPYEVSRRLKFLRESRVIEGYRVLLGVSFLDKLINAIIYAECSTTETAKIAGIIKLLPFQATFIPTKKGFILYILIGSDGFTKLASFLQSKCRKLLVSWGDYRFSDRRNLVCEAYVDRGWNSTREFMVEPVLKALDDLKITEKL